jgi:hypothetical protein
LANVLVEVAERLGRPLGLDPRVVLNLAAEIVVGTIATRFAGESGRSPPSKESLYDVALATSSSITLMLAPPRFRFEVTKLYGMK